LSAALNDVRRRQPKRPAAAAAPPTADDFQERLRRAMGQARGEEVVPSEAPAAVAEEPPPAGEGIVPESTGPVGTGERVIREGDCISSIAKETGHFWETIWNDGGNAELKDARGDPNVLLPNDRLHVPELRRKEEPGETEMRHRFRRLGEPSMLRLQLLEEQMDAEPDELEDQQEDREPTTDAEESADEQGADRPQAEVPYALQIDGENFSGVTDAEGRLEHPIPGNARRGRLTLNPGAANEVTIPLQLGHLAPITELSGVKDRLANLGFDCGDPSERETPEFEQALYAFQEKYGLSLTGKADQATRDKVMEIHGS
jgi:hypothetical protein